MSSGTWFWAKGRSQSQNGRGRTRDVDCGGSWPEEPDQNPGWSESPADCGRPTSHSPHQNWRDGDREGKMFGNFNVESLCYFLLWLWVLLIFATCNKAIRLPFSDLWFSIPGCDGAFLHECKEKLHTFPANSILSPLFRVDCTNNWLQLPAESGCAYTWLGGCYHQPGRDITPCDITKGCVF